MNPERLHLDDPDEQWTNDTYFVERCVGKPLIRYLGADKGMIQLGIASVGYGTARHDWRDLQAIKNQLAGKETEAFTLYPADSRLLDPCNYYSLVVLPRIELNQGWE